MAQYLEQFNYTLTSSSLPYAINNGNPVFFGGMCFLPVNSFISKDFAGSPYEFQGQNYVGNHAISFDLFVEFVAEATFTILCYGSLSLSPAIYANMLSSPYVQLCWTRYGGVNYNENGDEITLSDFNGTTINESGTTYRVTYLKKLVEPGVSHVAMHVVSPNGVHYKSGWAIAYDESDYHNQIGNNTIGDGAFAIGTISVQDELSNEQLDAILDAGEGRSVCATPVASPTSALFTPGTPITLSCSTAGADIYYTLDGSYPTTASTLYTAPLEIGVGITDLKFIAVASDYADSDLQYEQYRINTSFVETWTNLNNWWVDKPGWLSLPGNGTLVPVGNNPILKLLNPVLDIFVVEVIVATPDDALIYFINADSTATNFYDLISGEFQFGVLLENGHGDYNEDIVLSWQEGSLQQTAIAKFTPDHSYRLLFVKINTELMLKVFDAQTGDLVVEATRTLLVSNDQVKLLIGAGRAGSVWGPMSFRSSLTQEQAEVIIDTGDVDAAEPPVEVAAPVLTPASMSANSEVVITMACSTTDAVIRYTLDGTEPTATSALYTGAITVGPQPQPLVIGSTSVETVLGVSTPTVVLADGKQWTAVNATYVTETIGCFWEAAETDDGFGAYYTKNDGASLALSGALDNGWRIPNFLDDAYALMQLFNERYEATGEISLRDPAGFNALSGGVCDPGGVWGYRDEQFALFLALGEDPNSVYYYGSMGTQSSPGYSAATSGQYDLTVNLRLVRESSSLGSTATLKAKAFLSGSSSSTTQETYTFVAPVPDITPVSGVYASAVDVVISCALLSANVRYTLDGTDPTELSALYTEPLHLTTGAAQIVVKAAAFAPGFETSGAAQRNYVVLAPVASPIFSPISGIYSDSVVVTISAEVGASIWYTLEDPIMENWIEYVEPLTFTETTTLVARATVGSRNSQYSQASYLISLYQKKNSVHLYDFAFGVSA